MRKLDRTHKPVPSRAEGGHFAFRPIDDGARDGAFHLLRDEDGHQHCGKWQPGSGGRAGQFVYAAGQPIARVIAAYCERAGTPPRHAGEAA